MADCNKILDQLYSERCQIGRRLMKLLCLSLVPRQRTRWLDESKNARNLRFQAAVGFLESIHV